MHRDVLFEMLNNVFQLIPINRVANFYDQWHIPIQTDPLPFIVKYFLAINTPKPTIPQSVYLKTIALLPIFPIYQKTGNIFYCSYCHFYVVFPYRRLQYKAIPLFYGTFQPTKYIDFFFKGLDPYELRNMKSENQNIVYTHLHGWQCHCKVVHLIDLEYYQSYQNIHQKPNFIDLVKLLYPIKNGYQPNTVQLCTNYLQYLKQRIQWSVDNDWILDQMEKNHLFTQQYLLHAGCLTFLLVNGFTTQSQFETLLHNRKTTWKTHQMGNIRYNYSVRYLAKVFGFEYSHFNDQITKIIRILGKKD